MRNFELQSVVMDILGVILAVTVSRAILDGPLGIFLISKLGFWGNAWNSLYTSELRWLLVIFSYMNPLPSNALPVPFRPKLNALSIYLWRSRLEPQKVRRHTSRRNGAWYKDRQKNEIYGLYSMRTYKVLGYQTLPGPRIFLTGSWILTIN